MTDRIDKVLAKLTPQEREKIVSLLKRIRQRDVADLDVRKLKGHTEIFRIRAGDLRIIFRVDVTNEAFIISVERRSDTTYNF